MKDEIKKFLEFNGKKIFFLSAKGTWWIAIKPICEVLEIDYSRQLRTLKSDRKLGQLWSLQTIVATDGRLREMVCLPEFPLYGWLFKINSESLALEEYQWKCYELLYNYFHGTITGRTCALKEETLLEKKIKMLEVEVSELPLVKELIAAKQKKTSIVKSLNKLDRDIVSSQLPLWETDEDFLKLTPIPSLEPELN